MTLECNGFAGHGEAVGVAYRGETAASMRAELEGIRPQLESASTSENDLLKLLPSGGARNALDAALWDLRSKTKGLRAWEIAKLAPPSRLPLTATLSLDDPEVMAEAARRIVHCSAIKLKLGGGGDDLERVAQVRKAAPDATLIVDANGGWSIDTLHRLAPALKALGVKMIEQPLPPEQDWALDDWSSPVPLCADESCNDRADLEKVARRYNLINIKLDKCGGLTEALALARSAQLLNMPYMVGCMIESSLALAPATLLGESAVWCDLDGPLYLQDDTQPALQYGDGTLDAPSSQLWG